MDIFEPTPSQAAFILRRRLKDSGIDIPLSLAQEGIAQSRGFHDWNTLTAHIDPRAGDRPRRGDIRAQGEDARLSAYPRELSQLLISRWAECFETCWPEHLHRVRTEQDRERLKPLWREMDMSEPYERERRLRENFYLAVASSRLLDCYHYIPGAVGVGTAENKQSLQLVFQKRIENRFSLSLCPALNWDGLEVEFELCEFGDVMGDAFVDKILPKPILARSSESLVDFLTRALAEAEKIEEDFKGWMNAQTYMHTSE